jgi:hypothetical protein
VNQLEINFGTPLRIVVALEEPPQLVSCLTIYDGLTVYTARSDVMYTMPVLYAVNLAVAYVDAGGNPATVDSVVWASSNNAVVTIQPDTVDQTKCNIASTGTVGTAQVTATADVKMGPEVKNLVSLLDVTVIAGEAVAGTISTVGEATPIGPQQVHK